MKTALPALFFLFAFITTAQTSNAVELLRDKQGYPIINNGGPYYFLSTTGHGGLQIARTGNDACALSVVQVPNSTEPGLPLRISSTNPRPISTEEFVNIEFDGVTPSHWQVEDGYVKVGFNNQSQKGPFIFKEAFGGYGYDLLYCPDSDSDSDSDDACKYFRIVTDDDNNRRLVLWDETPSILNFHVVFQKKETELSCSCTCPEISMV